MPDSGDKAKEKILIKRRKKIVIKENSIQRQRRKTASGKKQSLFTSKEKFNQMMRKLSESPSRIKF